MRKRRFTRKVLGGGAAICLAILLVAPALAADPALGADAAEARILAALESPTDIDFIDEPLTGCVDYFKDVHQIEIQIDKRALEDVGVATDESVSKQLHGVTLRSALNLILRDIGLDWTIANEVLLITSPEVAQTTMNTRVYELGDLIMARDSKGDLWPDFDSMIELLTSTIEPETWEDRGGPGSIAPFEFRGATGLVIRHTPKVHQRVARLIRDVTALAKNSDDDAYPVREPTNHRGVIGIAAGMVGVDAGHGTVLGTEPLSPPSKSTKPN